MRPTPMGAPRSRAELEQLCRDAAKAVYLGDGRLLTVVLGGLKMMVDAKDLGITPHLAIDGFWESWVTVAMMHLARPGMRIINIGANMGYFSLLFAKAVGNDGSVIAIEPNGNLCDLIRQSKTMNGLHCLGVMEAAISDRTGTTSLVVPVGHCMNAQIEEVNVQTDDRDVRMVRVCTLDDLMAPHVAPVSKWSGDIDIVFVDAEGAEERIWDGAAETCKRVQRWVIEFGPTRYKDPLAFARKFVEAGYAIGKIEDDGGTIPVTPEALAKGPEVMATLVRMPKKGARP